MEVKSVSEKVVYGLSIRTYNATEMQPETGKIGALYQSFDTTVEVDYKNGERVYGVYYDYQSDHTGEFNVLAGFDGNASANQDLERVVIPKAKYLVFTQQGEMPQAVINAWFDVWQYFSKDDAQYQRLFTVDFEHYKSADQVEVHIAIK